MPPTTRWWPTSSAGATSATVFGWVFFAHQIGAASIAYVSGLIRVQSGSYLYAFIMAGILAIIGGLMALRVGHKSDVLAAPAPAPVVVSA